MAAIRAEMLMILRRTVAHLALALSAAAAAARARLNAITACATQAAVGRVLPRWQVGQRPVLECGDESTPYSRKFSTGCDTHACD